MSKVVIVGGGIAGLSAGIFAAREGYETIVYEKNPVAGGSCSYWKRGDYIIDNCIHWMIGTNPDSGANLLWKEVGALTEDTELYKRESFYYSELDGERITLWRDLARTETEMLALSPEDEKEIHRFIDSVKLATSIMMPKDNPFDFKNAFEEVNLTASRQEVVKILFEYGGLTLEHVADRFIHPLLKRVILDFSVKEYEAYWLVVSYSFFCSDNADVPIGGSQGVAMRLVENYLQAGGILKTGMPVDHIVLSKKKEKVDWQVFDPKSVNFYSIRKIHTRKAEGVILADGTFVDADYVICACDLNYTFNHLLKKEYTSKAFKKIYKKKKLIVYSAFTVAFAVDGEMEEIDDTVTFSCEPIDVGRRVVDRIMVKNYRKYGDYIAPAGKTVIQCMIYQYEDDFRYWQKLKKNLPLYQNAKKNLADAFLSRIEARYPEYEGKIHLLDAWTPVTYAERNNDYMGAFMRAITTMTNSSAFMPTDVHGLQNVFLASHWLRYPGGMPTACTMGKVAVERVKRLENPENKFLENITNTVTAMGDTINTKMTEMSETINTKMSMITGPKIPSEIEVMDEPSTGHNASKQEEN